MPNAININEVDGEFGQELHIHVMDAERGPQGLQGEPGTPASIEAGQAYPVPGGDPPAVINSGTSTHAVFDFYIPRTSAAWGDLSGDIQSQSDLAPYLSKAESSVQPEDINYTVMSDLDIDSSTSTSNMVLDAAKVNLMSGTLSSKDIPLPVASSTEAGIMNAATFDAVTDNSTKINAILGGMVAIPGLSSAPTQAQLTSAWATATGQSEPTNYSKILDVDNSKYWTFFTNTGLWYHGSADIEASIAPFTNQTDGTIRGSTNVGQIFAENDGTGSVNGWDDLNSRVTNNTNNMIRVGEILSQPSSIAYVNTANIVDGAVTNSKIDFSTMTGANVIRFGTKKIMWGQVNFSAASGQDTTAAVAFPETFNTTPKVMVTNQGWVAVRGVWAYNISTSGCRVGIYQVQGTTITANLAWVAIG